MTDSDREEVRGPGGFAAGCLRVQQQCGNDRTRCHHFCSDTYDGYSLHDWCTNDHRRTIDHRRTNDHRGTNHHRRTDLDV